MSTPKKPALCYQTPPLKKGDLVRVLPGKKSEREFWHHIAIVVATDATQEYPYTMRLLDHPYDEDIYFQRYERLGNAVEAVALLETLKP